MPRDAPLLPPSRVREGPGVGPSSPLDRPTAEARALRNNFLPHEALLWRHLQSKRLAALKFSRRMPIAGYKADFVCRSHRVVVELDGSQHADAITYDARRTAALEAAGYQVIRFWNNDLTSDLEGVLETIATTAFDGERAPTPSPSRKREGRGR